MKAGMTPLLTSKCAFFALVLLCTYSTANAQNTVTSGNWNDPTVWSGGAVPAASGTVNVNNPLTINTNLAPTGTWTFNSNATDQPGGVGYTFGPAAGTNTIQISTGVTVTFEGGTAGTPSDFISGTIRIFGTLILGHTELSNSGNLNVTIEPGGTLIINGDLVNKNNSGTFTINGALVINGNFNNQTGSVTVAGSGTIDATGSITTSGGSTVFGSGNDCATGPCSGSTLACTFDNYISPSAATVCSGIATVTFTSNPVTSNAPAGPTYQWQSSTDNVSFSNVGSNTGTYTTPTLTQTTYVKVTITDSGPCTSTSATATITVLSGGGWLGTTSDWGTASNWCSGIVPNNITDVVITNGTGITSMPLIGAGTAALSRNLIISNTFPVSSVTLASGASSLSISGDFTNNGTFSDNSSSAADGVKLVGSVAQSIAGTTANVFKNLTIANTSGANPAINFTTNNVTVTGNLTMTSGLINLNGFTVTLGTSSVAAGALVYSAGTRFYDGNIERWYPTASVTVGSTASQFPIGSTSDYRPIYFGNSGLSAGGTIKVRHSSTAGATAVAPTFVDNAGTVAVRSNSFWTVTTANSIGTGTHSLRTEGTGLGTVAVVTDLRQTLVNTIAPGTDGAPAGTTTNPQVNRTGLTTANLSNSFYWGSIDAINTPLPISLVSFTGRQLEDRVILDWRTESELNFDYFSLEKSADGADFFEIGKIQGHGTTQEENNYYWEDEKPRIGKNYYRLRSIDQDQSFEYSDIILVDYSREKRFDISPNPTKGESITAITNFKVDEGYGIVIFNNLGVILGRFRTSESDFTMKFPVTLPSGIYYAKLYSSDFSAVKRFVVSGDAHP